MFRTTVARSTRTFRLSAPSARPFSLSASRYVEQYPDNLSTNSKTKTDQYEGDKPHTVDKVKEGDTHSVQESNAADAME